MASSIPKLFSGSSVSIRINSLDLGTTRFKEGSFEILENDKKVYLLLKFNCGGAPKKLLLTQNVKNVTLSKCRIMVTLIDSSVVTIDQIPPALAQKTKEYLKIFKKENPTALKASCGSGSFSMFGNRPIKTATSLRGEHQINTGQLNLDNEVENAPVLSFTSPIRAKTTPLRTGLSEIRKEKRKRHLSSNSELSDNSKENDLPSNNRAITSLSRKLVLNVEDKLHHADETNLVSLQPKSFFSIRPVAINKSNGQSIVERLPATNQTLTAKRSLLLSNHYIPLKKVCPSVDYSGWNKPRQRLNAQTQAQLQGFSNLGNTCYMNAILQSLFSLPSFSNDLLKQDIPWNVVPGNSLLRRFVQLLANKDVSCHETKKDLLTRVKNAISSTAERFSGYMQNDAHEFLGQCLDQLKEDFEKVNKCWSRDLIRSDSPAVLEEPQQKGRAMRPDEDVDRICIYTCPVMVNMEFEVQHTIKCKGCGEIMNKKEQFNNLSIYLPQNKKDSTLHSIQDSLDLFFGMEEIEFSCEKCGAKAATVRHTFSQLPRVLILHLKRYSFNMQLSLNSKLGQKVVIPRYLTLVSHCTNATLAPPRLGWSTHSVSRGNKMAGTFASMVPDSETEGEQRMKEQGICMESAKLNNINDEEILSAATQKSQNNNFPHTSSPNTGVGELKFQDTRYHPVFLDEESNQIGEVNSSLDMDENKENQTPDRVNRGLVLVQRSPDQEREEQEFQQALVKSLQEQEAQEMQEEDDLKKATELSLQEVSNSFFGLCSSDEESGSEDMPGIEYNQTESEERNAEQGELADSYRLISVVSHIGSNSSSGHYVSDVYDMKKQSWLTYNDLEVSHTQETSVRSDRARSGYIFFYMHKNVFEELSDMEKMGSSVSLEQGKNILQPL